MTIMKMALPRRTFLRGVGATVALPLLDAMVPASTALAKTAAAPVHRLGFIYVPNGQCLENWVPDTAGTNFAFKPIMKPIQEYREHLTIVSGCSNMAAMVPGESSGPHARCGGVWLNGVRAKQTEGADVRAGKSVDQYAADVLGADTQLRSFEIALESNYNLGNCDQGYSCVYVNTSSWRTPTTPLPMEQSPRAAFERLFGDGDTSADRQTQMRRNKSILDGVREEMVGLQKVLGPADRRLVTDYLDSVREVEKRIQRAEEQSSLVPTDLAAPASIPHNHWDFAELMYDLMLLAYQADITRVVSFQQGRERSIQPYPWIGVPDADHDMSHHGSDPEKIEKRTKINAYHMSNFAKFVGKLAKTQDGNGTLLDHIMVLYGSGMGDGASHSCRNLPVLIAGGGHGTMKGGRHLQYEMDTPFMNACLSLVQKAGVNVEQMGDSTGPLANL